MTEYIVAVASEMDTESTCNWHSFIIDTRLLPLSIHVVIDC